MKTLTLLLLFLASTQAFPAKIPAELLKIEDGDTLLVDLQGEPQRIQLAGIDAPEDLPNPKLKVDAMRSGMSESQLLPLGMAATRHLQTLIQSGDLLQLSGNLTERDKYGRIAVEVFTANGRSLNVTMVSDGYARPLLGKELPAGLAKRLKDIWLLAREQNKGLMANQPAVFEAWLKVQK